MDPPRPDPTLLSKCCLIHDDVINDEKTEEKDIPLYFYPKETDLRRQVQVIQSCMAITSLASSCSKTPVSVVSTKRVKLVYKREGDYTMVLTGDIQDSNKALTHHIELVWDCFMFYNRDFKRLEGLAKTRYDLQKLFMKCGEYLTPLIENFHNSSMKFSPMPYCKLADPYKNTSAYFVMAWQVAAAIESCPVAHLLYGTAMIFKERVVSTRLDSNATRWLINFIEATNTGTDFSIAQKNIHYTKQLMFPVFIPSSFTMVKDLKLAFNRECWSKIKEIILLKTFYFTESNEKVPKSTRFAILLRISRMLLSFYVEQTPRTQGSICLVSLAGGLSVGMLTSKHFTVDDIQHVKASLERNTLLVYSLISTLEHTTVMQEKIPVLKKEPEHSDSDEAPLFFGQKPLAVDQRRDFFGREIKDKTNISYFAFDSLTDMIQHDQTDPNNMKGEAVFNAAVNWSRDIFSDSKTNKLVLVNHNGVVLAKKYFGKETFFHANIELEEIENKAREYLGKTF